MLALQRSIGNQAVQRLIQSRYIQTKLQVGAPGDQYEQEADRVADTVMRMPDPHLSSAVTVSNQTQISRVQRKCTECEKEETLQGKWSAGHTPMIQRLCSECQNKMQRQPLEEEESPLEKQPGEEEGMLQGAAESGNGLQVSPKLETQIAGLKGGGQPLPESVRAHFEPRFGHDFSGVRVHTGAQAAQLARSINAQAFTVGRDVAFGAGQYSPDTSGGQKLLAHELTHVVQQTPGTASRFMAPELGPGPGPGPSGPMPTTPFKVCSRDLQISPVGKHAYIEAPPFRYAIISPTCPQHWYDNPVTGTGGQKWDNSPDPCGKTPTCLDCFPAPGVTDVARCLRRAFTAYNNPSLYRLSGPNSNTFAGTLARTCCAGMVPKPPALGWMPGWDDSPAPPRTGGKPCPPGPTC